MELGSIFLLIALALLVGFFIVQPFFNLGAARKLVRADQNLEDKDHTLSILLASRDRVLLALQELDFDYSLGKIPEEDYPAQRMSLAKEGANILRQLDELSPSENNISGEEQRLEAMISARRAVKEESSTEETEIDDLELAIAARRRQLQDKPSGFCPKCGNAIKQNDVFCSRCGTSL